MSDAKRRTLATLGPSWLLDPDDVGPWSLEPSALEQAFGRVAPVMVDIGVGNGAASLAWAADHLDHDVLAVELHRPGIALLIQAGHAAGLTNVRVLEADVTRLTTPPTATDHPTPTDQGVRANTPPTVTSRAHLDNPTAPPTPTDHPTDQGVRANTPPTVTSRAHLEIVRVLFPDPWPKKRHVGRRLVDVTFVRQVTDLLAVGGTLHLATDWPPYADQMRAVIAAEPRLEPQVDAVIPDHPANDPSRVTRWTSFRPDRPVTPYEQRGLDAGRPITDLIARRTR